MIIVRHGEIYTKTEPVRNLFVRRLAGNIRIALPDAKIEMKRWRIIVEDKDALETLNRIFGVVSYSPAEECKADLPDIEETVEKHFLNEFKGKKFAVRTQKIDSKMSSTQMNIKIGDLIRVKAKAKVNLDNPEKTLYIELDGPKAYVFTDFIEGPGGLPLGTAENRVKLLGKKENDLMGAWMIMKRGASITPVPIKLKRWAYGNSSKGEILAAVCGATDLEEFLKLQSKIKMPLFAPLIGMSKEEITALKRKVL